MKSVFIFLFVLFPLSLFANENTLQVNPKQNKAADQVQLLKNELDQTIVTLSNLHNRLKKVNIQNEKILSEVRKQEVNIGNLAEKIESSNFFKEFIYPILLSIIAAIIFWFFISHIPEKNRQKKIRAKLDLNIFQVYTNMFSIFDLIMRPNKHSPSSYQSKIKGNELEKVDIELGLQNKCLNETYLLDKELKTLLLPTGKALYDIIKKTDNIIERIFNFSFYLSSDEILLLEEIRTQLHVYDLENYNKQAVTVLGDMKFYPVNPSLSYMSNNIYELFQLYIKLQDAVFKNKFENKGLFLSKIQHSFYSGKYSDCLRLIHQNKKRYSKEKDFLEFFSFLSEYMQGKHDSAYARLNNILEAKPNLVSSRGFLRSVAEDEKIQEILNKQYSNTELREFYAVVEKDIKHEKMFVETAKKLRDYFAEKSKQVNKQNTRNA